MRHYIKMTVLAGVLLMSSCGSNEVGTPITAAQFEALHEDPKNADKRFSITGYPSISNSDIKLGSDMEIQVSIWSKPNGEGDLIGNLYMKYKEYKNGVYLPSSFTPADLQVYDNEGNKLGVTDKITVSFTVDLDAKRTPRDADKTITDKDGKRSTVTVKRYFGQGPTDLRIDKAK